MMKEKKQFLLVMFRSPLLPDMEMSVRGAPSLSEVLAAV